MKNGYIFIVFATLLVSCSTTKNLPEDEILYTGIKEITYGKATGNENNEPEPEGVITALADAYNTVEGLLTGNPSAMHGEKEELSKFDKDSIRIVKKADKEAFQTTQTEVEAVLSYAPNGSLMGSSYARWPIHPRLAIYNRYINSTSRFGKWMFDTFSSTPRYVSNANPQVRTQVAQNTLHNYGYLRGTASYNTIQSKNPRKAKVSYNIEPGVLFHLDSIAYQMFSEKADSMIRTSRKMTVLHRGDPFSVINLSKERTRLSDLFRNNGYYYFLPDYITYRADTVASPTRVQLQIRPSNTMPNVASRQFHIGETHIRLMQYEDFCIVDTITHGDISMAYSGKKGTPPLKLGAIQRYLFYKRKSPYRMRGMDFIKERLQGMGIFSQLNMNFVPRDTIALDGREPGDTLDVEILAILDKPYDAEFEGKVTTKSNGQVGPGASFSVSKYNAFRGAETASLKIWGSYEWQTGANQEGDRSLINSYEYGANVSLSYPRFMFFKLGHHMDQRAATSTNFLLDSRWMNRANYFGRVSLGVRVTYTYQPRRNRKHEITPFRLDYDVQLHTTARFDSIVNRNQALYASMRDQFVPSMEYTYHWTNRHHAPRTLTLSAKEAGNITSALYSLTGNSWKEKNKKLLGVPYAHYLKATAEYTHKFRFNEKSCIATRIMGGVIWSYGNATTAPYNDLFTIGGANSIRAFTTRSIGPGSYHPANSQYSYIDQMGDLKFEANVEYRFPIVANLYGATFLDAGNVWLLHNDQERIGGNLNTNRFAKEIALGTGVGIRYDMDFLVIRFDLGIGLHAPYETTKSSYYNMTRFGKSLGYHLAIGYPF
ncbi:MAG: BamA/TamA family outer membrane protein [Bacteroidaceae bacterium]|nr:BamA/TamA family outer membrane protein [Bacteroidaceae bacterium]